MWGERLTVREPLVEELPVVPPDLHPNPSPELYLPAPLPGVALGLDQRPPVLNAGRHEHVADLQVRRVERARRLGQEAAFRTALVGVDVGGVDADPPEG